MPNSNSRRVYSSEEGRLCPDCGKAIDRCTCRKNKKTVSQNTPSDGIVRLRREVNGRGGKTVIVITGLPLTEKALKELGGKLKKKMRHRRFGKKRCYRDTGRAQGKTHGRA